MSAALSRRESFRDTLVSELSNILTSNTPTGGGGTYRTDVQLVSRALLYPDEVENHPSIIVILGNEQIQQLDMNRTVFHSVIPVVILGYYKADTEYDGVTKAAGDTAGEKLFHDMKRCIGSLILKNVNDASLPWHILGKDIRGFGPVLDAKTSRGECRLEFEVQIQRQDIDF
jgi:hypothetical protein